jgi:hypothetical protein
VRPAIESSSMFHPRLIYLFAFLQYPPDFFR